MIAESPSVQRVPTLGGSLSHIVHYGGPTQPKIVGFSGNIVEHLERMIEIILVGKLSARFHNVEI